MPKEIELTQDKVALVDDSDFDFLNQWKWHCLAKGNTFYARRRSGEVFVFMHSFLAQPPCGFECDHKDRDGLNNQRSNLRLATRSQNGANRRLRSDNKLGFRGVSQAGKSPSFRADIVVNNEHKYLGCFASLKEAAQAYDDAAFRFFGQFASLNFPKQTNPNER